jgi:hypothetical protein
MRPGRTARHMPALDFKGKSFIYTHHLGVPYRELLVVPEKSCPAEGRQPDLDDNRGYDYTGTQETELHPPEKVTWTTFSKDKNRNEILERIEGIENLERGNYDKIEKKITDGVLTITGQKQVKEKMPGLGSSFTYLKLGEAMDLERLLAETPGTLPSFPALARYLFFTATGHTLPADQSARGLAHSKTLCAVCTFFAGVDVRSL